jgi:hypothetical protein
MNTDLKERYDAWLQLVESEEKRKTAIEKSILKWSEAESHINISRTDYLKFEIISYLFEAEVICADDIITGNSKEIIDLELDWILDWLLPIK